MANTNWNSVDPRRLIQKSVETKSTGFSVRPKAWWTTFHCMATHIPQCRFSLHCHFCTKTFLADREGSCHGYIQCQSSGSAKSSIMTTVLQPGRWLQLILDRFNRWFLTAAWTVGSHLDILLLRLFFGACLFFITVYFHGAVSVWQLCFLLPQWVASVCSCVCTEGSLSVCSARIVFSRLVDIMWFFLSLSVFICAPAPPSGDPVDGKRILFQSWHSAC